MNLELLKEKPIFQMTGEEFLFLQRSIDKVSYEAKKDPADNISKKYVYGIRGIARLIGCSISSANRLKKSGVIDEAIIQNGRKIIVDSELALELIKNSK
tara:strand:+ start:14304 stop:14600 length:297 start_codon:yes stop_codon:yes gene_type:complete